MSDNSDMDNIYNDSDEESLSSQHNNADSLECCHKDTTPSSTTATGTVKDTGTSTFADASTATDVPTGTSTDATTDVPTGTSTDLATETVTSTSTDTSKETVTETATIAPLTTSKQKTKKQPLANEHSVKAAEQAYRSASLQSTKCKEPWLDLDSGAVAWPDFSSLDQQRIARHFAPKVKYLASRLKLRLPKSVDVNDLISAGSMGLVEAFSKFMPEKGVKFDTYAENRIRGAMLDELRRMDWFSRSLRQKVRVVDSAINQTELTTGQQPTEEEIIEITGLSLKDVREAMEAMSNQLCVSLDVIENTAMAFSERSFDEPFESTMSRELIEMLASLIDELTPREKMVLSLYYSDELNMREAAEVMGITEGRVSQLHSQALSRLRKEFQNQLGQEP